MRRPRVLTAALLAVLLLSAARIVAPVTSVLAAQPQTDKKEIKVWVNTRSGVYHCPGTRWYRTTKSGAYMSQGEAQQHGYRPAYGKTCQSSGPESPATPSSSPKEGATTTKTQHAGNPDVKVWVNKSSGVYHCPGTRWYGNTKQGEYMTQGQAQDAGFRPAYAKVCQ